jgi:hypothetical protein
MTLPDFTPQHEPLNETIARDLIRYSDGSWAVAYAQPDDVVNFRTEHLAINGADSRAAADGPMYCMVGKDTRSRYFVSEAHGLLLVQSWRNGGYDWSVLPKDHDLSNQPPVSVTIGEPCEFTGLPEGVADEPIAMVFMAVDENGLEAVRALNRGSEHRFQTANPIQQMRSLFEMFHGRRRHPRINHIADLLNIS